MADQEVVGEAGGVQEGRDDLLGHLNLIEACREGTRWGAGGGLVEEDGLLLFASGTWLPVECNGAFRLDPAVPPERVVERADQYFGERKRGWSCKLRDLPEDADLAAACEAAGVKAFGDPAPEMHCGARLGETALPSGVTIRALEDVAGVSDYVQVTEAAYATYGMPADIAPGVFSRPERVLAAPHVLTRVAYQEGRPVGAALALLSHGIAGVYWVGTVPETRRQGLGAAITVAITNAAFDAGAGLVTLQASVMGAPVYRALGYEERYFYQNYVRFPAQWGEVG